MKTVGLRFKHLRKLAGLSQLNFAKAIGLSQGRLSDIETNQNKPSADTIISVMEFSNASADWILQGVGPIHKGSSPVTEKQPIDNPISNKAKEGTTLNDLDFINIIHQLNEVEKHYIFNLIQYTLINRFAPFNIKRSND